MTAKKKKPRGQPPKTGMDRSVRINVTLPKRTHLSLKREAEKNGLAVSAFVRVLLTQREKNSQWGRS